MAGDDAPPRALERRDIQRLMQLTAQLLDIHSRTRFEQSINQHAVLQREQRIRIFDFAGFIQVPGFALGCSFEFCNRSDWPCLEKTRAFPSTWNSVDNGGVT